VNDKDEQTANDKDKETQSVHTSDEEEEIIKNGHKLCNYCKRSLPAGTIEKHKRSCGENPTNKAKTNIEGGITTNNIIHSSRRRKIQK